MRTVTKEEFFAAIGPRDVNPRVDVSTLKERHHVSTWEVAHTRKVVGRSRSDSWGSEPTQFYLADGVKP